ncbi:MAG: Hsp20/alpha crystallin family protein [Candidatus Heimdallarchaeaceae archaeon]
MAKSKTTEIKSRKFWVNPHVHCNCDCGTDTNKHEEGCADTNDEYRLIYELPGVKKENISIKVVKNGLRLSARRDKHSEFVNEYPFLMDADPEETVAHYNEGLLVVHIPIIGEDPFKQTEQIKID